MLVSPMTQTKTPNARTWMIRFTAAAALVMFAAMPVSAQLGGAAGALGGLGGGLPGGIPAAPEIPVSAGADLPGLSAQADGASARACIDSDAARSAVDDAKAQAEGLAAPVTSAAAPVTSQVDAAKAQVEGLASPVTSQLPDPDSLDTSFAHCIDSDDPEGSAMGAADKAQGKATGFVAQVKGFFGSLRSALPF